MRRKNTSFGITVMSAVLVILFCAKGTVMSQGKTDAGKEKQYYALMEEEYCTNMRQVLEDKGYYNSGITIGWVSEGEGRRSYTVVIHHRRIDRLDEEEKEALIRELSQTEFTDSRCSFQYEL